MDADVSTAPQAKDYPEDLAAIGSRLKQKRVKAGISQRELARRIGLSASLISQLESGMTKPSVGTLYAIVTELGLSIDSVIRGKDLDETPRPVEEDPIADQALVVRHDERQSIDLASGVRWEELTAGKEEHLDFLIAIYEVGGSSTPDKSLMRHHGREFGYIISGTLGIQIGFSHYELRPGDSIAFDSTRPHRLFNDGDEPVHAVWVVVGREDDDRSPSHSGQ
jgi:transcriptional regulator with XRE-family HTH domain